MDLPRVFNNGREIVSANFNFADVLIVCGQGVYNDGRYYGEFHDRDVYFDHALKFPNIAKKYNYNIVVTSGGFTQPQAPWLSEAESFLRILKDGGVPMPRMPVILDEVALDSSENFLLSLMTARLVLGKIPIRRIGIWAAWQFKKWRFNRNAQALRIVENTYFHGLAPASLSNVQVPPDDARQRTKNEYDEDSSEFRLLRDPERESKRKKRWQNNRSDPSRDKDLKDIPNKENGWSRITHGDSIPKMMHNDMLCSDYRNRLVIFDQFVETWKAIGKIFDGEAPEKSGLADAFASEVMRP